MKKRIFIIGQCTLHWGRMEFGNIGNYYIARPMFQQLRRVFPDTEIVTTMQFSEPFCKEFSIETVPMELYYDFASDNNLKIAIAEYESICNNSTMDTAFLREVRRADLVIDFSGDIWGKNADFLGKDRFLTGCYKDLTAQMVTKTVMLAGSPGPFHQEALEIAKKTYSLFDFVINREPVSTILLRDQGFDIGKTYDYPCPSFLFEKASDKDIKEVLGIIAPQEEENHPLIGFILCGWNFRRGPFDAWPRNDSEYEVFVRLIKELIDRFNGRIILMSHSNGFDIPPKPFVLKQGRDFPIVSQLKQILDREGIGENVILLDGVYTPEQTKAIVSHFDVLISGRMHGAVAGLSQGIPTLILDYGHEPKAHKLRGFAKMIDSEELIADPNDYNEIWYKSVDLIENRTAIGATLTKKMKEISAASKAQFDLLESLLD